MESTKSHASDTHRKVLRQHAEIRVRLHGLATELEAAAASPLALRHLRISLHRLASLFAAHLAFEEAELIPRMREIDRTGRLERALLAEHLEQRARLEGLCATADDEPSDTREVAGEVSWLIMSLLTDMAIEEREFVALQRRDDARVDRLAS